MTVPNNYYYLKANEYFLYIFDNHVLKNNKTIIILHDIDSLRGLNNNNLKKEICLLNNANYIIAHNNKMTEFLKQNGFKNYILNLTVFDYLLNKPFPKQNTELGTNIVFAGNLSKSEFLNLKQISDLDIIFNLYGPNFGQIKNKSNNIVYKGNYNPELVPYKLEGSFGLIWDGDSLETCSGDYGKYLEYNNPHKLSLYIAAGIPVITWKGAAIADFIKKYNIGFTVNSIYEISEIIGKMTLSEYEEYKNNLKGLQEKVCSGFFTKMALEKIIKMINQNEKSI